MSTMIATAYKRLAKPEKPAAFRITPRDVALMRALASHRFMTTRQLALLDGGSERGVRSRLRGLFALGYVKRPDQQGAFFGSLNPALVYNLTKKGLHYADNASAIDDRLNWIPNNTRASSAFMEHTIDTAAVMIAFRLACSGPGAPTLVDHHALIPDMPAATQARDNPFKIAVSFQYDGKPFTLSVVPDRLFRIDANKTRSNLALELDRGTMVVSQRRKKITGRSSFLKKIVTYHQLWQQDRHTDVWGFKTFRVLTVTTSQARINSMLAVQRQITDVAGLFLYTTPQRLAEMGVFGPAWQSSKADGISLLTAAPTQSIEERV
ncbi:MAG: replication-relaxation family protein [Sulfuricaulis sp.]|nr:replication-relaxation family protein [Sulfuricaulis sp.]